MVAGSSIDKKIVGSSDRHIVAFDGIPVARSAAARLVASARRHRDRDRPFPVSSPLVSA